MKVRKKWTALVALLLCVVVFAGCDTYYYGTKKTSHRSKVNGEKTMYVHRATFEGHPDFPKSYNAKPAGKMPKQRKIRK